MPVARAPRRLPITILLLLVALAARTPAADLTTRAMLLLKENCIACHNPEKHKGKLVLTTRDAALHGGDNGAAVVPGDAAHSPLAAALLPDADPHMPPKGQLTPAEITTLKSWIDAGANWDQAALTKSKSVIAQSIALHPLPANFAPVLSIALSPDQKTLAAGRGDRILLFDLSKEARPLAAQLQSPNDLVYSLAWSPDGATLATGHFRRVRLWNAATGQLLHERASLIGRVTALAFTPDGQSLVAADGDASSPSILHHWQLPAATPIATWGAHGDTINALKISRDGKLLATAGADKLVKTWDLAAHTELAKLEGHSAPVTALALSADAAQLASAGADKEIKIFDLKTREQKTSLLTHPAGVTDLAWVDAKTLLSTCDDGLARFSSDANRDRATRTFAASPDALHCAAPTADGKTIYAGCQDGNVYAWSAADSNKAPTKLALAPPATAPSTSPSPAAPINFANDVMPLLSRAGCNAGACHAKPAGQGGFKLSVFAYDPKSDFRAITREARGRRVFPAAADQSLLLLKPTMAVEHGGGLRLKPDSDAYRVLRGWIEQGMPYAKDNDPVLVAVNVSPAERQYAKRATQPLKVTAKYSDGSTRDVTGLADFLSNDKELARVDEAGVVRAGDTPGEGVVIARYMGLVDVSRVTVPADKLLPDSLYAALPVNNFVDEHVYARLKKLGLAPSDLCTDAEFLRRASLDVTGTLPTPADARAFLADAAPDKRAKLVDRLLQSPAYADHWANKWGDLMRPNPFRVGVKGVFTLDHWLRDSFRQNKPYDQFMRDVLTARGSTHKDGPTVVYRDRREPADATTFFSQIFLGVRFDCARCHHHPNEKWGQEDFFQFAAFFDQVKHKGQGISAPISGEAEFMWFVPGSTGNVRHPVTGELMKPKAPDAPIETIDPARDPRDALAAWLARPDNPFFARAIANRVWGELLGRGIVHPVDDFRASNPPTNGPLLDALAKDFVDHKFDLKHLIRTIANSRTYQLSSMPGEYNVRDTKNFSRAYRRRPTAEVSLDAINALTGTTEPLQGLAPGSRAVQVWNNRLDSEFLDAFGRPNASADPPCERDRDSSVVQALHLMNSTRLTAKIADPKGRAAQLAATDKPPREVVAELYLAAYSRPPTEEEAELTIGAFAADGATRKSATEDILWALINSAEFIFNH